MAAKERGLGRGLSALMGDDPKGPGSTEGVQELSIDMLYPTPFQPRRRFDMEALQELSASIAEKGVLQPLLVRKGDDSNYEIIAGERRWRAAQQAGVHKVPVVIRELSDSDALQIAIIENIQREDLTAVEEAEGYKRLLEDFNYTQEQVSALVGKSRSHIANLLRLLQLPDNVRAMIHDGVLSMGHARALIGAEEPYRLAQEIVENGLSVRATEALVSGKRSSASKQPRGASKDADTRALEKDIAAALGLSVSISHKGERGGKVTISYKTLDQLDHICQKLMGTSL